VEFFVGDFLVQPPGEQASIEMVFDSVKSFDERQWNVLIGNSKQVKKDLRDPFVTIVLNCQKELERLRTLKSQQKDDTIGLVSVIDPVEKIFPADAFIDFRQIIGTRFDDITQTTIEVTLYDYVMKPQHHCNHAALFLGGPHTTGFGKTRAAMRIAWMWAKQYAEANGEDPLDAYFLKYNDIDSVRAGQRYMRQGKPIIFDEMDMKDQSQVQYMSENGVKILGDVGTSGNMRARNKNVSFAAQQPRIITANSTTLEEWLGDRMPVVLPMFRKFFVFRCEKFDFG